MATSSLLLIRVGDRAITKSIMHENKNEVCESGDIDVVKLCEDKKKNT